MHAGYFFFFVVFWFFNFNLFQNILSWTLVATESQTVWVQPDIVVGLIWVQLDCKGFQQTTQAGKELMDNSILKWFWKSEFYMSSL